MSKAVHFNGLNGIRAIAAVIVLIFHIDQFSPLFGLASIGFHKTEMAGYAVTLFFVLSGYLITRLLLIEKKEFQRIDLRKFYLRRILRIWPIYYLVIIISIFIYFSIPSMSGMSEGKEATTFFLYSFLLSNVGYGLGLGMISITPLWSVGVEEQFYAFWPLLLDKSKNVLKTLIVVILVYLAIKTSLRFLEKGAIYGIVNLCRFDCMALGGIGAYLVYSKSSYLKIVYHPILQVISWGFLLVSIFYKPVHLYSLIDHEFHSIFYLIIIINVSSNQKTFINLESKLLDFVGQISYGIYVYHMSVIVCLSLIFKHIFKFESANSIQDYLVVFASAIAATLAISYLSYNYFEAYFLKLKNKFSKIESLAKM